MRTILLHLLLLAIPTLGMSQSTPTSVNRGAANLTQVDQYLTAAKRLGIPTSETDNLAATTSPQNTAKILYNTTLNKLRVYNPVTETWRDAIEADLTDYYTKEEIDILLGGKQNTLVSGTNIKTINGETLLGSGNIDIEGALYTATNGITISGSNVISPVYGTTAGTIAQGNDSRINNGQTAYEWGDHAGLYLPLTGGTVTGVIKSPAPVADEDLANKAYVDSKPSPFNLIDVTQQDYIDKAINVIPFNNTGMSYSEGSIDFGVTRDETHTMGAYAFKQGVETTASGYTSIAFGQGTIASETSSAFGAGTIASGWASSAFGLYTEASGYYSAAFGIETKSLGLASSAFGSQTIASGLGSSAFGLGSTANEYASLAIGRYSTDGAVETSWTTGSPIFKVGNGTSPASRSNAYVLYNDGKSTQYGIASYGADYSANFTDRSLVDKAYVDSKSTSSGNGVNVHEGVVSLGMNVLNAEGAITETVYLVNPTVSAGMLIDPVNEHFKILGGGNSSIELNNTTALNGSRISSLTIGAGVFDEILGVSLIENLDDPSNSSVFIKPSSASVKGSLRLSPNSPATLRSDLEITDIGDGVIIKSPDGTRWRITVDNSGNLITTSL